MLERVLQRLVGCGFGRSASFVVVPSLGGVPDSGWSGCVFAGDITGGRSVVPLGEEPAANALRVGETLLVGSRFPRTIEPLDCLDYNLLPLDTLRVGMIDAGLSCMSLRWGRPRFDALMIKADQPPSVPPRPSI